MKLHLIIRLSVLSFISLAAYAQDIGSSSDSGGLPFLATEDEMPAAFASKAQSSANDYVAKKGWDIGFNPDCRYVVIGVAGIPVSPDHKGFQNARANAFDKAMLNAKEQIASYYALEIAQEIANSYGELGDSAAADAYGRYSDPSPDGKVVTKSSGIVSKVKRLIHAELDAVSYTHLTLPTTPYV